MALMVDEVSVGQVFLEVPFYFTLSVSLHQCFIFNLSMIITI